METTIIDNGNLQYFTNFLLPDAVSILEEGKPLFALGLVDNGIACGALAGGPYDNTFKLTSFFIAEKYRGKGGASLLLDTLITCMLGQKELYEISVDFTVFNDDHLLFKEFLEHKEFVFEEDDESIYSVKFSSLAQNPYFANSTSSNSVVPFSEIPAALLRELDGKINAEGYSPFEAPLEQAEFDRELSVAIMDGNKIDSFILFDHSFAGMLTLAYAETSPTSGSSAFSSMLHASYQSALKNLPSDTEIIIQAVTPLSAALVKKLATDSKTISKSAYLRIR